MKKEIIDGYEIYTDRGELKEVIFKDYIGNNISVKVDNLLQIEFDERKREEWREDHERRRHFDNYLKESYLLELRFSKYEKSAEDILISKSSKEEIISEIWKLPTPQNRRVYMYVVDNFSYTEISRIEQRDISVVKRSVDSGLNKLREKLKKF